MAKLYTVEEIVEMTNITQRGTFQKQYRVTARSKSGIVFSLDISEPDFTQEKVDQLLSAKAELLDKVKQL